MISKCNDDELTRHLWILQAFTESLVGSLTDEGAVRPREIVEALPVSQLSVKIYVTGVCQQLVEFLLVRPVRGLESALASGRADSGSCLRNAVGNALECPRN